MDGIKIHSPSDGKGIVATFFVVLLLIAGLTVGMLVVQDFAFTMFTFVTLVILIPFAVSGFLRIVSPFEFEMLIDDTQISLGKSNEAKRRSLLRSDVICFCVDHHEKEVCLDTGRWRSPLFATEVLSYGDNLRRFCESISLLWPEVPVLEREQYQNFVQDGREALIEKRRTA